MTSDTTVTDKQQQRPFSYRSNRLLRRQVSSNTRNPFIAGVDASDLWLSPPQASLDGDGRSTSLPATAPSAAAAATKTSDTVDFSLLGGDLLPSDFLLPSYSYSSPPSPGRGNHSNLASSAALFPSIDSWIHSNQGLDVEAEQQEEANHQPIASTSYDPLPFYSPPSSAGALSSPSSSPSASSSSPQLLIEDQDGSQPIQSRTSKKRRRRSSSSNMANTNTNNNPAIINTDSGAFNVNSKSGMKDACSYDLRDHQEPATVQKEYGGNASENKDLNGLQAKVENTSGPVCFPRTAITPAPTSPSRFANPQDVKPHIGADPSSSSLAAATNGSSDMSNKPLSSSSGNSHNSSSNNNNIALDPSLGQSMDSSRPSARAGQPSFLKNTGDGMIRTPGPNQMLSPKAAFNDYDDILKRSSNGGAGNGRSQQQQQNKMQQGSPRQQQQQMQLQSGNNQQQQHGSPMQQQQQLQQQQFKLPPQPQQQQLRGDIQVPQMNLPQMPQPQQAMQQQQNSFQAQPQQPPPPGQYGDVTEAQLLAALGGQRSLSQQGSPQNTGRGGQALPNQQQQQQQRGMHQMGNNNNQSSPQQQRQLQTQPAPQPMTVQQQNAARQAAYQGFMAHPPPTGANTSSSTDIQVPQSNQASLPSANVGTPSAGQSSLPPLPNYQSAPAPLAFNDGSFFSHQAILASLQAEENAKAAAAAAAVMGFQNGNWTGGNGQQQGQGQQQQQNGNNYGNFAAQPGQQQQGGLPPFAAPGGTSVLGDFSFEQHFGPPPPAGNSPDASTSSRKRIKGGKSGSRGSLSRSNSTTSNNGNGRNKAMAAEARALQGGQYGGAFNFGAYGNNNNNVGVPQMGGINDLLDAEGEEDDEDSKPQFNSRGMPKRKSASAARELAQAQQKDHNEEFEYQGFIPKGSGIAGGIGAGASGIPPLANLGAGGVGGAGHSAGMEDSDDSDDDDGDEWVAEESDDSYGRKKKGGNKRGRKSGAGKASLTPAEAEALRAASPTTAAAALASVNANGTFDFSGLLGDYSVGSPDSSSGTPGPSKKRKSHAAAPGSGNISCDYVDPKTGERCPVKFRRPYDQARHMETVHSGQADKTKWACVTCKKSFSRKDALIRHGRISSHPTM